MAAYETDRARARAAAGSPTEFQGRAANTDGAVRYTAPSLVFDGPDGQRLEAGGFQPIEAYDVVIANLDPTLERRPPAEDPVEVLSAFPYALTTAEVAAVMAEHLGVPNLVAVEAALITATGEGRADSPAGGRRLAVGSGPGSSGPRIEAGGARERRCMPSLDARSTHAPKRQPTAR